MSREIGYTFTLGAALNPSFKGSMGTARSEIKGLAQNVRSLESSNIAKLGADFERQRTKIAGLGRELRGAQVELTTLRSRATATGNASGTFARQIEQAEKRVQGLSRNLQNSSRTYKEHIASIKNAEGSVRSLRNNYKGLAADIDRAKKRQEALSTNLAKRDALNGQRGELQGRLVGTMAMGLASAAPAVLSVKFEDSMARVGALSNATGEDIALLTAQARQLGRETVFSASQAAEGMGYLAMAGFDTKQTMAAMPGMLQLAAAGNTDLGRTADIASNILSGFKLNAAQMGMASDVLAKTFTSSNTTLESLGETMKYVGPVAASVGMSIQETAAATGLLGSVGIQGSQAGTALRAALLRLAAPPKMAREALAELTGTSGEELDELAAQMEEAADASQTLSELGVNTKDATGNLRPLADILEEINAKTVEMGTGDKAEVFKKVFGTEASASMIALADKAGEVVTDQYGKQTTALRKYIVELENSGGTAARISAMMNDTTGGALRQMNSALEDVGIGVGNLFLPVIRSAAKGISGLASGISWLVEKFPTLSKVIAFATAGVVTLSVASLALGYASNIIGTGINTARRILLLMSGAQITATSATHGLTVAQRLQNLTTMSWIGLLGGARARLLGLGASLTTFTGIQSGATASTVLMTTAQNVWAGATAVCSGACKALGMAVRFALGPIGLILTALTIGAGLIIDNWDTVGPYFEGLWNGICGIFQGAWNIIKGIVDNIGNAMDWVGEKTDAVPVLGSAKRGLGKAWDWAFGDDEGEAPKAQTVSTMSTKAQPVAAPNPIMAEYANVPRYASPQAPPERQKLVSPKQDDSLLNIPIAESAATQKLSMNDTQAGLTTVTVPMTFNVQGLDANIFKQKLQECEADFRKIVLDVVNTMQHDRMRRAHV